MSTTGTGIPTRIRIHSHSHTRPCTSTHTAPASTVATLQPELHEARKRTTNDSMSGVAATHCMISYPRLPLYPFGNCEESSPQIGVPRSGGAIPYFPSWYETARNEEGCSLHVLDKIIFAPVAVIIWRLWWAWERREIGGGNIRDCPTLIIAKNKSGKVVSGSENVQLDKRVD